MAVMCLFSILIFSALTTKLTNKFNNNTSKYLLINCVFTGNITHTSRFGETMNLNASFSLLRSSIARSRPIMIFAGSDPQLSLIHFGETINSNFSAFSCSSFSLCSPFLPDCHLNLSHQTVFFVGAAPPLSLLISHLANLSFTQATFPSKFKLALISPLLKKPGLPKSDLANFRPISNLNTIGKILERLALSRIFPHISKSPSFSPLQSAY